MGRYNSFPQFNSPPEPLESALHVGKVRVRPYKSGSVKHPHVVLRKVDEEIYEDPHGRKRRRGVFSLFAQKVINCKPGKELFFAVDKYIDEHVLAFEADLLDADDVDNDVIRSAKSDETLVQRESQPQSLPPKIRKMWAKRESMTLMQGGPRPIVQKKVSVGVQTDSVLAHVNIPGSPMTDGKRSRSTAVTPPLPTIITRQAEPVVLDSSYPSSTGPCLQSLSHSDSRAVSPNITSNTEYNLSLKRDLFREADLCAHSLERSLSPMDLESEPPSPRHSPQPVVHQIPPSEVSADKAACEDCIEVTEKSIRMKEEPEDTSLPLSLPQQNMPVRSTFRAPIFVPARRNPFQKASSISNETTPTTTPTPLTVLKNATSASPVLKDSSALSSTAVEHTQATRVASHAGGTLVLSANTRPAPVFVPPTHLFSDRCSSGIYSELITDSRIMPMAHSETDPIGKFVSESTTPRKRKRTHVEAIGLTLSETQFGSSIPDSKKRQTVVKQEPKSPVLSQNSAAGSIPDVLKNLGQTESATPSLSVPPFSPSTNPSATVSQAEYRRSSTPLIKTEQKVCAAWDVHPSHARQNSVFPSVYHPSTAFMDLTGPKVQWDGVPTSPPVERFSGSRRTSASIAASLPVIKTAQIKMNTAGRDTVGVRSIAFDSTGARFAVICRDNSIRIWDNDTCVEIAKLAHNSMVILAVWMDGVMSIASMGSNGVISKWTLIDTNKWMWEKIVDSYETEPSCFAYDQHRIAVTGSRRGIQVWECVHDQWEFLDLDIHRRDILSIKFVNDGTTLLCACSDGSLVQYSIPSSKTQVVTKFKTKVFHVDVDVRKTQALVAQAMGSAHLVDISQLDRRAFNRTLQDYSLREAEKRYGARGVHGFKPIFTDHGDAVVFGSIDGRVLVWNRQGGQIIYEMDHGNNVLVQAVSSFDGSNGEQQLVTCTKQGLLTWWRLPFRTF